jgi:hypothetical protein
MGLMKMLKPYIKNIMTVRSITVFFISIVMSNNIFCAHNEIYSDYKGLLSILKVQPENISIKDKQLPIFSEYVASNLVFINRAQDLVADKGLLAAINSIGKNAVLCTSYFGAIETSQDKVGSGLNVNGVVLMSGLAQKYKILTVGAFVECGNGDYGIIDNFETLSSIKNNGDKDYIGGGLLCHLDFFDKFYLDCSGRKGLLKTNLYSFDLISSSIFKDKYCNLDYFSSHAGIGCKLNIYKNLGLDIFSKYFFTHQDGKKDVTIYTGEILNFSGLNSQRLLCGLRFFQPTNTIFSFYGGLSAEYEFLGDVKAFFEDKNIPAKNLKGYTETIEIGVSGKSNSCIGELSLQSYLGMREGYAGTLKVSFVFFDYLERFLGYSLKKFENEKNGRFNNDFSFSKKDCFLKILGIIKELKGRVTHKSLKKGYIVAFDFSKTFQDSCLDSTEVCIYVQDLKNGGTNVEVVSNNNLLSEELSKKLFQMLNKDK